jgi:hypothetical protein
MSVSVLGRWWNGVWGRMGRRDVWLSTTYTVTARQGDPGSGKVLRWHFRSEDAARAMVVKLQEAPGPGAWKEMNPDRAAQPPDL